MLGREYVFKETRKEILPECITMSPSTLEYLKTPCSLSLLVLRIELLAVWRELAFLLR